MHPTLPPFLKEKEIEAAKKNSFWLFALDFIQTNYN